MNYDGSGLSPGDVLCLDAGNYSRLRIHSVTGSAASPIIVCNINGLAHMNDTGDTVDLDNCQHMQFTGSGHGGLTYGIKLIKRLKIREHSNYVELDHIEMYNDDVAISIINDEDRADFQDFNIHHNYIHDIRDEGMYIGNAGKVNLIKNVEVHSNTLETIGEGIQVGWTEGYCKIHDNYIEDVNTDEAVDPCYAAIGITDDCESFEIYNNEIRDSDYRGMNIQSGEGDVYNNLIVNVGHVTAGPSIKNFTDYVIIYNNTIITATEYGIDCSATKTHNEAYNNIILDTTNDSIDQGGSPDANFYDNHTKEDGYTPANYGFVDQASGDYHLDEGCDGIDAVTTESYPAEDIEGVARPQGDAADIGCYEYYVEDGDGDGNGDGNGGGGGWGGITPTPPSLDPIQQEVARLWEETRLLRDRIANTWDMSVKQSGKISLASMFLNLPALRALWLMSSIDAAGNVYDMGEQGRTLTYNGDPKFNFVGQAPFAALDGAGDFLSRGDENGLDLIGTESYVTSAVRGFTIGGWFSPADLTTAFQGIITKGDNTINNDNFRMWNNAGTFLCQVCNGGDTYAISQTITTANRWYFWVMRFVPSTSVDCYQNGVKESNTTSIPASANNSNADLNIGALNGGGAGALFTGRVGMCFLCVAALDDDIIQMLFQRTRALYRV